ncbi:plasma-membrane choline transporter-domain-containing protein [Catenaria anguillulae PL171]|uniref:Protein PNS1 n=1 Tax=Catenaria anguillulae PL171 TaxID=765915 RepID=A0A1Y2HUC2_9FUNG|nr:plasma-membrane choline transporter-domain-containing protein [Catenaria anguillulae PL171]
MADVKTYPYPPADASAMQPMLPGGSSSSPYPPSAYPPQPSSGDPYNGKGVAGGPATAPPGYGTPNEPIVQGPPPEARFQPPNGPQDLWAAILFVIHFLGFGALTAYALSQINWSTMRRKDAPAPAPSTPNSGSGGSGSSGQGIDFGTAAISAVIVAAIAAVCASIGYLLLMRKFPKQLIKLTYFLTAFYFLVAGGFMLVFANAIVGGIFLFCAALNILVYFWIRKRIPFTAVLLSTVADVTAQYTGPIWLGIASLLVELVYAGIFTLSIIACSIVFNGSESNNGRLTGTMYIVWVFLVFSMYWTTQVCQNVVHVSISGVFAAFYFLQGSPAGMPANPTMGSLKRAMTTSFGSICYGSLLVAIIQTLRAVIDGAKKNNDSPIVAFIICCIDCLLACLQGILEAFNKFAFCQVAIYGKDYCRAAKDTWQLIKDRGIEALIADSLIDNVLGFGMLLCAGITTLVSWLVYAATRAATNAPAVSGGVDVALIIVLITAAVLGALLFGLLSMVIDSGVTCTFVCLAEDPAALKATKPELWEKIRITYPEAAFVSMYS